MPFAKSKDCLGALPVSKEGTPVWQEIHTVPVHGGGVRGAGRECPGSLAETCRISYIIQTLSVWAKYQGSRQLVGPGTLLTMQGKNDLFQSRSPAGWKPFSKLFSHLRVGHSNMEEASCICLLLELPAIAWPCSWLGHGPKALLAICCGWACGHRASALSRGCMFPARRIERKWWDLSSLALSQFPPAHWMFANSSSQSSRWPDFSLEGTGCFSRGVQSGFYMRNLRRGVI